MAATLKLGAALGAALLASIVLAASGWSAPWLL